MSIDIKQLAADKFGKDEIRSLLVASIYNPTPERIRRYASRSTAPDAFSCAAYEAGSAVGLVVYENVGGSHFTVVTIFVDPRIRRHGVGRRLINHIVDTACDPVLEAETDDDAVAFYHSLGFRIQSLGEKYPGVRRYRCVYDHRNWEPTDPADIAAQLEAAGIECWVSGGWAIDLFIGRQTRPHHDTDVTVRRSDQTRARNVLSGWESFATHAPGLRLLRGDEYLESVPNTWHRTAMDHPWRLDMQYVDVDGDQWLYRRKPTIRGKISEMGFRTPEGTPYLRPEIQLLYKAGGSSYRDVDVADLRQTIPVLNGNQRTWLIEAIRSEFPQGHAWVELLREAT